MRSLVFIGLAFLTSLPSQILAQEFTQTVKGTVTDKYLMHPVAGVKVSLNYDSLQVILTDSNGRFEFTHVPVGRVVLTAMHSNFSPVVLPNLLLNSGKELIVNIQMEEQVTAFKGFKIKSKSSKFNPINDMSTVSARTFSVEETQNFAAAINDPARMATSFAGVIGADDGNNSIVIRGNSPAGLLWRMEGIDIPGPNHFASFNGSGGGVSILSAQLLSNSDFMTGAFSAEYGNALSGVFDLRLRKGNDKKREYTLQAGFLGLDFAAEGPLSKKGGSFLVNYRYSTLGIIKNLGIDLGISSTLFQDLSFNIAFPKTKLGQFSIFGFGGISTQNQNAKKDSSLWKLRTDRYDMFYGSNTAVGGITQLLSLNSKTTWRNVMVLSSTIINDKGSYYENDYIHAYTHWKNSVANSKLAFSSTLNRKINRNIHLRSGLIANYWLYDARQKSIDSSFMLKTYLDNSGKTSYVQGFTQFKLRMNRKLDIFVGFHALHFQLNRTYAIEPRLSARYSLSKKQIFSFGFGQHSQLQLPGIYFAQKTDSNGQVVFPNKNIGLSKARHWVASYELRLKSQTRLKVEAYFQDLYQIPVGAAANSNLSVLNLDFGIISEQLVNHGKGQNYGLEITAERFLDKGFYYLVSASLFNSRYKTNTNQWFQTRFNSRHAFTLTGGKEMKLKGDKKLLGFNIKTSWYGGFRETPVDEAQSRAAQQTITDDSKPFSIQLPAYFRTDLKFSYRINHRRYNSIWSLDIQNASNRKNVGGSYYDFDKNETTTWYQTPLIPVFSYKIEF